VTDTWTIISSPALQAAEAAAELEHLAQTAVADQALLDDDAGPDWRAVEHAEHKLAFIDADASAAVKLLDEQNDARGREIQRLRAQLAEQRNQALVEMAKLIEQNINGFGLDFADAADAALHLRYLATAQEG
jgi:hypothetical protein